MKKFFRALVLFSLTVVFVSCTSNEVNKIGTKVYNGEKGGQVYVDTKKNVLGFKGIDFLDTSVNSKNYTERQFQKIQYKEYSNPKVISKDGKKYLTADNFPYELELVSYEKIFDKEDDNTFNVQIPK